MSEFQKKQYTMEDNVKTITFTLKDIVKKMESIDKALMILAQNSSSKNSDEKDFPY